jgi:hypothetical protein
MMADTFTSVLALGLLILLPLALVAVGVLMVVSTLRSQRAVHAAYAEFAKRVHGQLIASDSFFAFGAPQEIRFQHGKTPCSLLVDVEVISNPNPDQDSRKYYLRLAFDLGRPAQFTCRIVPQSMPKLLAGMLRTADVRLGFDDFDRQFIVEASDELRAPDVLCRPIQEQLIALSQAAAAMSPLDSGHVALQVRDHWIEIRIKGFLDEVEQLWPFYQLGGRLFEMLSPRV